MDFIIDTTPPLCVIPSMPGHLPQSLCIGVYKAYGHIGYGQFMRRVVALQEGTMSLEAADNDVKDVY